MKGEKYLFITYQIIDTRTYDIKSHQLSILVNILLPNNLESHGYIKIFLMVQTTWTYNLYGRQIDALVHKDLKSDLPKHSFSPIKRLM